MNYVSIQQSLIQAETVSIVRHLARRSAGFIEVFKAGSRYEAEVFSFREGLAWALHDGLHQPRAIEDLESTGDYLSLFLHIASYS